ncbi:MAG: flagellar hook-length control protein FliK, partial [Lachnospiraceae bacterium]|nr:flagellar hook-length control protein FliK [Lachnospiraceae bacterium]
MGSLNVESQAAARIQVMGSIQNAAKAQEGFASFTDVLSGAQTMNSSVADLPAANKAPDIQTGNAVDNRDNRKVEGNVNNKTEKTDNGKKESDTGKEAAKVEERKEPEKAEKTTEAEEDPKVTAVKEAAGEVKSLIAEELGISEEDLEAVMETLGLAEVDLLNPQSIPRIVAEVKDVDTAMLISDESLSQTVTGLMGEVREKVSDLVQELDVTPEEFKVTIDNAKLNAEVISEEIPEETIAMPVAEETVRTPAEAVNSRNENISSGPDGQPEEQGLRVVVEKTPENNAQNENLSNGEEMNDSNAEEMTAPKQELPKEAPVRGETHQVNVFQQNLTNAVNDAISNNTLTSETNPTFSYTQAQDILDQISSQIRIRVEEQTQTMQMELNPASLGRVGLHIESRAGAVTAQFEATNATVKEVLEGQIVELKHNL